VDALIEGFSAGGLNGRQAIIGHAAEDLNHLAATVVAAFSLRRIPAKAGGSTQSLNGAPLRRAPGLRARVGT
jgi:hypothetical protein